MTQLVHSPEEKSFEKGFPALIGESSYNCLISFVDWSCIRSLLASSSYHEFHFPFFLKSKGSVGAHNFLAL